MNFQTRNSCCLIIYIIRLPAGILFDKIIAKFNLIQNHCTANLMLQIFDR